MKIEELVLDGFKSYPVRTTIDGWDSSFNAITGLNGSGKSNILDAICFVLGITNLSAVRAANLQDLIYKRGQAGITKASVTIVFDNSDKSKSPVGFEKDSKITVTRQISMTMPTKYLVNGHKATQQSVTNLFQSVQLNISNPNFLIMQGKITKVLNMKPAEVLGLIEEAAGTSMFEDKKDKAVKTMTKKQKKLEEITGLLTEEINPKLEKLREQKRTFLEYQKSVSELERLSRLVVAYDYVQYNKKLQEQNGTIATKKESIAEGKRHIKQLTQEIANIQKEIKAITKRRDQELAAGGKVQQLEQKEKDLAKEVARIKTKLELKTSAIQEAQAAVHASEANVESLKQIKESKLASTRALQEKYNAIRAAYEASFADIEQSENLLQSLITGLSSSDNAAQDSGYMGQLATARAKLAEMSSEAEQAKIKLTHLTKELKEKEPRAKKAAGEGGDLNAELAAAKAELQKLEQAMQRSNVDAEAENTLGAERSELRDQVQNLTRQRDASKSTLSRLNFDYASPSRNFDRSKVKGLVANLVSIDKKHFDKSTALEIAAGSRLYNVVVEDDVTGSELLKGGQLQQRVTIIPLNKISAFKAASEKVATAKRVSNGKADLALNLVGYPNDVAAAMAFVFGSTLICDDAETAQQVAFHPDVKLKSVTMQGDVYNPSGLLEGGSEPSNAQILVKVKALQELNEQLKAAQTKLDKLEREWQDVQAKAQHVRQIQGDLDLKKHEVGELEARLADSSAARIIAEVDSIKQQIADINKDIAGSKPKIKAAEAECKRIEKEMKEFETNRDSKLKELKAQVAKKKSKHAEQTANVKNMQRQVQTAQLEATQMDSDIEAAEEEVKDAKKAAQKANADVAAIQADLERTTAEHAQVEADYKEETKQLSSFNDELAALEQAASDKDAEMQSVQEDETKTQGEIERTQKEVDKVQTSIQVLVKEWPWVKDEQDQFGVAGGQYDFASVKMADEKKKCMELQEVQQRQKKKINPKVMTMIDNVEKKQSELQRMYDQVLEDKEKIQQTIAKLDDYKRDALQKTWQKVNGDFGAIFGELLPGNFAKLEPPEDQDIMDGLEVKVRLGQVWKQSLTELSGGQRSLIALSLIMSLLQFKPAPMYILDEVDAALDLSHTQHIGQLFRTRFKGSQFIVVSLKEGLFTNANVLFRARFRDGTSVVQRTVQRSTSELYERNRPGGSSNNNGRQRIVSGASVMDDSAGMISAAA